MTVTGAVVNEFFFSDHPMLSELEKVAKSSNLQFIEELIFENGAVYKGYLENGMRHGPGVQIWPDGAKYEGDWRRNKANG